MAMADMMARVEIKESCLVTIRVQEDTTAESHWDQARETEAITEGNHPSLETDTEVEKAETKEMVDMVGKRFQKTCSPRTQTTLSVISLRVTLPCINRAFVVLVSVIIVLVSGIFDVPWKRRLRADLYEPCQYSIFGEGLTQRTKPSPSLKW
jgi:hypothetical protein